MKRAATGSTGHLQLQDTIQGGAEQTDTFQQAILSYDVE
jgi:hypothetical protein